MLTDMIYSAKPAGMPGVSPARKQLQAKIGERIERLSENDNGF
jgi:hypothetical protein